jgi:hypothetical protein
MSQGECRTALHHIICSFALNLDAPIVPMAKKPRHRTEATLTGEDSLRCEEQTRGHDGFASDLLGTLAGAVLATWEATTGSGDSPLAE